MKLYRIKAVLLHSWYHITHSVETWTDLFWNPLLDMLVYFLIAASFASRTTSAQADSIIIGNIFWNIVWIGQFSVAGGALWEIWSQSFSNLFVSSLTLREFLTGQMISGFIKSMFVFILGALLGYVIYHFSVLSFGVWLLVYIVELLIFSYAVGMLVLGLIFRFGVQIQSLSWLLIFLYRIIGAVFYAATVLPGWMGWALWSNPLTYIFEAMRQQNATGYINGHYLVIAMGLDMVYIVICYMALMKAFQYAKDSGSLVRMEG
ncbi:ABC transporter permease [Candidatus Gottesmanbacteria bacterium]|nr:ABC transporter permease [Candidatus Gottesmanbacteria bacterium]